MLALSLFRLRERERWSGGRLLLLLLPLPLLFFLLKVPQAAATPAPGAKALSQWVRACLLTHLHMYVCMYEYLYVREHHLRSVGGHKQNQRQQKQAIKSMLLAARTRPWLLSLTLSSIAVERVEARQLLFWLASPQMLLLLLLFLLLLLDHFSFRFFAKNHLSLYVDFFIYFTAAATLACCLLYYFLSTASILVAHRYT